MTARMLVVDDDAFFCTLVRDLMMPEAIEVVAAHDIAQANQLRHQNFHVALLDNHLPDGLGLDLVRAFAEDDLPTKFLVVTANPSLTNAVEALRLNIVDYLVKPIDAEALRLAVLRTLQSVRLEKRADVQARAHQSPFTDEPLPEDSPWHDVEHLALRAAQVRQPALITGETGTGKTHLARRIHEASSRSTQPFVALNCAAMPESLVEAELFGVARGAYTGAHAARPGLLELADGGTLLLDEIGELSPTSQAKLLGVIEDQSYRRVGDDRFRRVDVRLIAATHVDLERAMHEGRFRPDVFFRLDVLRMRTPALRERPGDLGWICRRLLRQLAPNRVPNLGEDEIANLRHHDWPGNLRELRNVLERCLILQAEGPLRPSNVFTPTRGTSAERRPTVVQREHVEERAAPLAAEDLPAPSEQTLRAIERGHIFAVLDRCLGRRQEAAEILGISPATLRRKLKDYGSADVTEADEQPADHAPGT